MAINKITAPLAASPSVFAQPVLNQLAALLTITNDAKRYADGNILKGAIFNIGGTMYMADSDTAISGTTSDYIAITASGDSATASYTANINNASWNGSYKGWFDTAGVLYIFDESIAFDKGVITKKYNPDIKLSTFENGLAGTYGTFTAPTGVDDPMVIPKGLYMFTPVKLSFDSNNNKYYISLKILDDDGVWRGQGTCDGLIWSDGIHFGLFASDSSFRTIYYRKLL